MSFLDYAARGHNHWARYLGATALGIGVYATLLIALTIALMIAGFSSQTLTDILQRPDHPLAFFPANGVVFGAALLGFAAAIRVVQAKRFGDIIGDWRWSRAAAGAGLWLVVLAIGTLIDLLIDPGGFRLTASPATGPLALAALAGLTVQTFTEEFVFRGWLTQGLLLATRRPLAAAALSGALFGALHIPNGIPQAIQATAFGLVAAMIAMRSGGIAFTCGLHLINNLFGAVVVVSADDVFRGAPGLFSQHSPHLIAWDAGFAIVALALALALAVRVWPRPAPSLDVEAF